VVYGGALQTDGAALAAPLSGVQLAGLGVASSVFKQSREKCDLCPPPNLSQSFDNFA